MLVCLVHADAPDARRTLLGLTLLQRAALLAQAAGATTLGCEALGADALGALVRDGRLRVPVLAGEPPAEAECVVLRADALCPAPVLRALAPFEHVADGRGEKLAARVRLLPGRGPRAALAESDTRAVAASVEGALLVHDAASVAAARRALLDALIKPTDGPVSRHLNRHLSRAITQLVLPLGMTPNQMTVLVALAGGAAAWLAAQPGHGAQLLGAALFQLHSVIDGCDGELARLTHRFGKHGALLDSLVDDASNAAFFFGLSLGVARATGASWPLWTGGLTVACYAGVALLQYAVVLRATGKGEKTAFWSEGERAAQRPLYARALHALGRRDVFVLVILCAVALGLAPVVVAALPVMAVGALLASVTRVRGRRATVGSGGARGEPSGPSV